MKKNFLLAVLVSFLFTGILESCDKKKDNNDINNTPNPPADTRDQYLGDYLVRDSLYAGCLFKINTYVLQVSKGNTAKDTLFFGNFCDYGSTYYAILTDSNISIPTQHVVDSTYISGNGYFENNKITYETSGDVFHHMGIGTKQ